MIQPKPVSSFIVLIIAFSVALHGLTTHNPFETIWTCALILILLRFFWWSQHPGIILFTILIPFIEIHTTLLEANQSNVTLNELFFETGRTTFLLSSVSLLAVALGVKTSMSFSKRPQFFEITALRAAAQQINQRQLVIAFIALTLISQAINSVIPYQSSIRQIETYIQGITEALLLSIAIKFMIDRKNLWLVVGIFFSVILQSFYNFFSTWKDPILLLLVASQVRIKIFNTKSLLRLTPIILPAIFLILVWQSVKVEYRTFLNGGAFSQQVVVSQGAALSKLKELASATLESQALTGDTVIKATYRRIGYLEYFSAAVSKVPSEIPHERGQLLTSNMEFALIPRIINPNKGNKDDLKKVTKYTNFSFGSYGGSSFSLGHYCEAYIDWGKGGMLLQMFLFGVFGGSLHRISLKRTAKLNPILALGILWVCMKPWGTFQQDMITMTGQVVWGAVCHLVLFLPIYRAINQFLLKR